MKITKSDLISLINESIEEVLKESALKKKLKK